ncbi:hypothetical protein HN662_00310, partial [Candidatus Woesearchaeota archaeon]|nr:hypothetical protein [Candidatus Woesearchaeota archaeon]
CQTLLQAYKDGSLGQTIMPEDSHPVFKDQESKLIYFTLPMSLNYQRDSYALWKAALATYNDPTTNIVFNLKEVSNMDTNQLQQLLSKHKLALQPNKHTHNWKTIAQTITTNFSTLSNLLKNPDYLTLKQLLQIKHKKGFPYLSGPKIFNYWCFILNQYCNLNMNNSNLIEIAPDTHITKCSIKLGVIKGNESKEQISNIWREALKGSNITPIQMHPVLWFWSKNNFLFKL